METSTWKRTNGGKCAVVLCLLLVRAPAWLLADRWCELRNEADCRFAGSPVRKKDASLPVSAVAIGGVRLPNDARIRHDTVPRIQTAGIYVRFTVDSFQEKRVVQYAKFGAKLGGTVGAVGGLLLGIGAGIATGGPLGAFLYGAQGLVGGAVVGAVLGGVVGGLAGVVSNLLI